ncbi:MAG: deoxyribose-phosphate aldolase [Lentisphaerae bacterium]|nr:deoxyribose-phosphate aldolase [Lentisphaerota bacterium]
MFAHTELEKDHAAREAVLAAGAPDPAALARLIDATVLKPDTTAPDIRRLCGEAVRYGFRAVCVPPVYVAAARERLGNAAVRVCTVAGFPWGYATTAAKAAELRDAFAMGADEVDFVQNDGWVRAGNWPALELEYKTLAATAQGRLVKIILETSLLSAAEIRESALRAVLCGVHVVKTATGFGSRGASEDDVRIMAAALAEARERTGTVYGLKASGGIRTAEDALRFVRLGATRLGTSSGAAIVDGV